MIRFLSLLLAALLSWTSSVTTYDVLERGFRRELDLYYERIMSDEYFADTGIINVPVVWPAASKQQKAGHERPAWQYMGLIPCVDAEDAEKFMS